MYKAGPLRGSLVAIFLTIENILVEIFSTATMADRNVDKSTIVVERTIFLAKTESVIPTVFMR